VRNRESSSEHSLLRDCSEKKPLSRKKKRTLHGKKRPKGSNPEEEKVGGPLFPWVRRKGGKDYAVKLEESEKKKRKGRAPRRISCLGSSSINLLPTPKEE